MEIVIATDNNFAMASGILMTSVCENNKEDEVNFHYLVDSSLSDSNKEALSRIADKYKVRIVFYSCSKEDFPATHSWPNAIYYRLFASEILPSNLSRVIYLDCDMIVRHSLRDLWSIDISEYAVGCVPDMNEGDIRIYNRLKYDYNEGYFNSGMLIINLDYWRREKVKEQFLNFASENADKLVYPDQDILNVVFRKRKLVLPLKYNFQDGFVRVFPCTFLSWKYEEEIKEAAGDPYIIHYTTKNKPWIQSCNNPYKKEFFKYRELTEWKYAPLSRRSTSIAQKIRTKLFELNLVATPSPDDFVYREDVNI